MNRKLKIREVAISCQLKNFLAELICSFVFPCVCVCGCVVFLYACKCLVSVQNFMVNKYDSSYIIIDTYIVDCQTVQLYEFLNLYNIINVYSIH